MGGCCAGHPCAVTEHGGEEKRRALFVEDFVDVASRIDAVCLALLSGDGWLEPLAGAAEEEGATLLMRIGPAWAPECLQREVRAQLGACRPRGEGFVLWLRWEETEHPALFPVLDGDLEVAPVGDGQTRITLSASYVPPLGLVGRGLDRALLHRLAQSTVRSFLTRVRAALEPTAPGQPAYAGAPQP